jgi:hypothetical protein
MTKRLSLLAVTTLLYGCGTYVANVAPDRMRGMSMEDLFACAGFPTQKMKVAPDIAILEYDPKLPTATGGLKTSWSFTLPLGTSFSWVPPTYSCHMQVTLAQDGTVYDVDFSSSDPIKGLDGACAALVKQCVYDQSSTGHQGSNYDAWNYLFPGDTTTTTTTKKKNKTP